MATVIKKDALKKEKVTISLNAELLHMVDAFVQETKADGASRSSIIEQALYLWKQHRRDQFDLRYYSENAEALKVDNESWSKITTESAQKIWTD
jgi:metal-responsive CopG/Arc/MetJ family transcriptional regulator